MHRSLLTTSLNQIHRSSFFIRKPKSTSNALFLHVASLSRERFCLCLWRYTNAKIVLMRRQHDESIRVSFDPLRSFHMFVRHYSFEFFFLSGPLILLFQLVMFRAWDGVLQTFYFTINFLLKFYEGNFIIDFKKLIILLNMFIFLRNLNFL